jgi:hypothetical protein
MSAESPDWSRENPEFAPRLALDLPEPARDRVARAAGQIALHPRSSRLRPLVLSRSRGVWAGWGSKGRRLTERSETHGSDRASAGSR